MAAGSLWALIPRIFFDIGATGAITSQGNFKLSQSVYPHPSFCHIGAGGRAANCHSAYLEELERDEEKRGKISRLRALGEEMTAAKARWPSDFGGEKKLLIME